MKRAVVLLSGGIDSATTLAIAIAEGYEAYALSFDYGQRHHIETEAARRVANRYAQKSIASQKSTCAFSAGPHSQTISLCQNSVGQQRSRMEFRSHTFRRGI